MVGTGRGSVAVQALRRQRSPLGEVKWMAPALLLAEQSVACKSCSVASAALLPAMDMKPASDALQRSPEMEVMFSGLAKFSARMPPPISAVQFTRRRLRKVGAAPCRY